MSFSENIEEDKTLQSIYEKIIFDDFHKITKQIKQQNNKRYVYRSPGLPSGSEWNCSLGVVFVLHSSNNLLPRL
jgi:hypothetical protein